VSVSGGRPIARGAGPIDREVVDSGRYGGPNVTVSVELVPVGAAGLNAPVTPAGALPKLNVTAPVKLVR